MDYSNYTTTPVSKVASDMELFKRDPTALTQSALETVESILNGEATLMSPGSPFIMLMEMACVTSANAVRENLVLLRRQYPMLSITSDEIYHHMADEDYLGRFSVPAELEVVLAIQVQGLINGMVRDESENAWKAILPRDTSITVDGITFMPLYPIVLRRYDNGILQINYDSTYLNPVMPLRDSIITPEIRTTVSGDEWVFLKIKTTQVKLEPHYFTVDKTYRFKKSVVMEDQFHHARVYFRNDASNRAWVEMRTTHSEQTFDARHPTAVLKVDNSTVTVEIPVVYLTSGLLSGEVRMDVYTSKGEIHVNMADYRPEQYTVALTAIDAERDSSVYTLAMADVSYYAYSLDSVNDGKNGMDFNTLRKNVIYNADGPQNLPITNVQLSASGTKNNFEIVKNVDMLTNRVYLATRKLPQPKNSSLITSASIGIVTMTSTLESLKLNHRVIDNGHRVTIKSKSLFESINGQLKLLSQSEQDALQAMGPSSMVTHVNNRHYLYSPFYCVLDNTEGTFEQRVYSLDQPLAKDLNILRQNHTLQLFVNTGSYELKKTNDGYSLKVLTRSSNHYIALQDNEVGVQLAYYPHHETTLAYINGVLESKNANGERLYRFDIQSSHDFNVENSMEITNSEVQGVVSYKGWVELEKQVYLIHHTTSISTNYRADETDGLLGKFLLPSGSVGNTLERLTLHFGDSLDLLWSRARSFLTDPVYQTHSVDIPLLYTETQYGKDPVTGSIFDSNMNYIVKAYAGDQVMDEDGNPVYKHRVGDVVLNEQGQPVISASSVTGREFDLLVVDGRYLFANDLVYTDYRTEIDKLLTTWITKNVQEHQNDLLEITKIYFYPRTTIGLTRVYTENHGSVFIPSEQAFTVELHVQKDIFENLDIRKTLRRTTIQILDAAVSESSINMTAVKDTLRKAYGASVDAFEVTGLGGSENYQLVTVSSNEYRLCLKKKLEIAPDRSYVVTDDVNVEFKLSANKVM